MGTICSCDRPETSNTSAGDVPDRLRPERDSKRRTLRSYDSVADDSVADTPIMDAMEGGPFVGHSAQHPVEEQNAAICGFKEAVRTGHHEEAMHYVQEFTELDLFNEPFGNGDNALHIATRNGSYDLVAYLLANGMAVRPVHCTFTVYPHTHTAAVTVSDVHFL